MHPAYTQTLSALERSGLEVTAPSSVDRIRTLLEDSVQADLRCGQTDVRLNYHTDSLGWIAGRFQSQTAWDYADYPLTQTDGASLWGPKEAAGSARAALCLREGNGVTIWELTGPAEELVAILDALKSPNP